MKDPTDQNSPIDEDDGIDRRGFLECMTWAGTGVIWMLSAGVPRSFGLSSAEAASALAANDLTFLQISDSHVGFDKPANPDEPKKPESRLAVFGDSDFATNGMLGIQGNPDLFMNTVSWLAQQENLIAIRPRNAADRRLTMTAEQQRMVFWLTLGVPLLLFGAGFYTWSRRR